MQNMVFYLFSDGNIGKTQKLASAPKSFRLVSLNVIYSQQIIISIVATQKDMTILLCTLIK